MLRGKEDVVVEDGNMVAARKGDVSNAPHLQITNAIRHRVADVAANTTMGEFSYRYVPLHHLPHKIKHSRLTS